MFISNGGCSSDCTQTICDDDPIFNPFIGSGLGRAKTPNHFSGGHLLIYIFIYISGCNGKSEEIGIKWFLPHSSGKGLYLFNS
jgi:hypothetical protein